MRLIVLLLLLFTYLTHLAMAEEIPKSCGEVQVYEGKPTKMKNDNVCYDLDQGIAKKSVITKSCKCEFWSQPFCGEKYNQWGGFAGWYHAKDYDIQIPWQVRDHVISYKCWIVY